MIRIYTDGSCLKNPGGASGSAWLIIYDDGTIERGSLFIGGETNNIAELRAVVEGFMKIPSDSEVLLFCDSKYVLGLLNGNKARANKPLVKQMIQEVQRFAYLEKRWVRGHSGEKYNEEVDRMAREAAENPGTKSHQVTTQKNLRRTDYTRAKLYEYVSKMLTQVTDREFADKVSTLFAIDIRYNPVSDKYEMSGKVEDNDGSDRVDKHSNPDDVRDSSSD